MADIGWFTRVDMLPALGIELAADRHANILRWHAALRRRPAFATGG